MTIVIVILILVVLFAAFVANKPNTFRVERGTTINAQAEKIYPLLSDFHQWGHWSPWEKLDPDLKRTYSGAPSGKGAVYAWEGNKKVGAGRMEITEATSPSRLVIKLDFLRPFEAHNVTEFQLRPAGAATQLAWTMTGQNTFMGKMMDTLMSMDKMIGKDFEAGLANLKEVAEK
jgi:uncharacterized protein YndB with AHSA1/START domain